MRAVIDRFEDTKAVLLLGETEEIQAVWPRQFLPANVQEGDILQFDFRIDSEATSLARSEAEALLQQVLKGNKKP
ncbi:MAG: DUF3006 domain-containing protein [Negativicutes bacterium]